MNISPDQAREIVGDKYASRIEELALACYKAGAAYAEERGIIIADTKFEFGLDEETDEIYLVDEVLTYVYSPCAFPMCIPGFMEFFGQRDRPQFLCYP